MAPTGYVRGPSRHRRQSSRPTIQWRSWPGAAGAVLLVRCSPVFVRCTLSWQAFNTVVRCVCHSGAPPVSLLPRAGECPFESGARISAGVVFHGEIGHVNWCRLSSPVLVSVAAVSPVIDTGKFTTQRWRDRCALFDDQARSAGARKHRDLYSGCSVPLTEMWRCSRTVTVYTITDSIRKRVVEVSWALHYANSLQPNCNIHAHTEPIHVQSS